MKASPRRRRPGFVIIPVLLCFVLITLICGAQLKITIAQREQIVADERRLQAEWLVESALDRAAARLAGSPEYAGETWSIAAEELGTRWPGAATIQVEKDKARPRARRVTVVADYPRDGERRSRLRKQVILEVGPEKPGGSS